MIKTYENVAQTAERIINSRPVLEPVIKSFEKIFEAKEELPTKLLTLIKESNISLPEFTEKHAENGLSLLSGKSLKGFEIVLAESAKTMLPLLAKQEYLSPYIPALEQYFLTLPEKNELKSNKKDKLYQSYELAEAYLIKDPKIIENISEKISVPAEALLFAFHFILAPTLKALVINSYPEIATLHEIEVDPEEEKEVKGYIPPWDHNSAWKEGYCPICTSLPSLSYLDRALFDENNQFLASGGGKKYLHCSLCGTNWHFKRGTCPSCKNEGPDAIEILREAKSENAERIDWCTKCKSYCPNIDLRVAGKRPDFDMMALGLMHLDIIAAEKKLIPLTPSFWNTFEK